MAKTVNADLSICLSNLVIPYGARAADVKKAIIAAIDLNKESAAANIAKDIVKKYQREKKITYKNIDISNTGLFLRNSSHTDIFIDLGQEEINKKCKDIIANSFPKLIDIIIKHGYNKCRISANCISFSNDNGGSFSFWSSYNINDKKAAVPYHGITYTDIINDNDICLGHNIIDEEFALYEIKKAGILGDFEFDDTDLPFNHYIEIVFEDDNKFGYKKISGNWNGYPYPHILLYERKTKINSGLTFIEEYLVYSYYGNESSHRVPPGRNPKYTSYGYRHEVEYSVSLIDENDKDKKYCRQYRDCIDSFNDKELTFWLSKYVMSNPENLFKKES